MDNGTTWRTGTGLLLALLLSAPARADFFVRDATCSNATTCTVSFPVSSSVASFPRQLSCFWSQSNQAVVLRRVLLGHQPTGLPVVPTLALPIDPVAAQALAFNLTVQPAPLLAIKGGKLNALFEWDGAVTATVKCTYILTK